MQNIKQTQITDELLSSLSNDERDAFLEATTSIPFVANMISDKRCYAKDRPRDEYGRIIVDITNPHILENMDYFRQTALHYIKYGCYTKLRPNSNPNSEYAKWLHTEIDRIWHGMVREEDGEWIPGSLYFYWNYCPILQSKIKKGSKKAERIISFPEPWDSTYLWAHYSEQAIRGGIYNGYKGGEHFGVIARRGIGKSLFIASMLARLFICGDNEEVNKSVKGTVVASDKTYLQKDGTLNKFVDFIDHCAVTTQFPAKRIKSSLDEMHWIMGYRDTDNDQIIRGTKNEVSGMSVKDNSGRIRGKRALLTVFEEFGSFPNFLETYNTALYNAEEGGYSFGTLAVIGTGGSKANDFSGALEMIYHPEGYHMYPLPNVFDKNSQGKSTSLLFLGAYLNRKGYYDDDGNSDVVGALVEVIKEREHIKRNSSDPSTVTQKKAEMPITIQECIMKTNTNIYPVADINERLNFLTLNPHELDGVKSGKFNLKGGEVSFELTNDEPIHNFPHKDNHIMGAVEMFKEPEINKVTNSVFNDRYIAGLDTYDNDVADSLSLGSIFVLDTFTDQIVCEYTGRPTYADEFYEIARRMCLYYNCKVNYEQNKKGLYAYFSRMNSTYLLTDRFEYLSDKDLYKGSYYGNVTKGTTATAPVKAYARKLIRDWLLKPCTKIEKKGDEDIEVTYPNLENVKNIALLKELSMYNLDGNFDRHDALAMLMIYREDILRLCGGEVNKEEQINGLEKDSFFDTFKKKSPVNKHYRAILR